MRLQFQRIFLIILILAIPWLINQADNLWNISRSNVLRHATKDTKSLILLSILGLGAVICARIVSSKSKGQAGPQQPLPPTNVPPNAPYFQQRFPPQHNNRGNYP